MDDYRPFCFTRLGIWGRCGWMDGYTMIDADEDKPPEYDEFTIDAGSMVLRVGPPSATERAAEQFVMHQEEAVALICVVGALALFFCASAAFVVLKSCVAAT